ncbi:MAG: hypothetical protein PVJ39_17940 [Gammaproteobacteria bacterium]|jgi:hypothetical protein
MDKSGLKRVLRITSLLVAMSLVGGCLVSEGDTPPTINRTTNDVRTIVSGDFYLYDITGQITNIDGTSRTVTGTLKVEYTADTLPEPFSQSGFIPDIFLEVTTLTLGSTSYTTNRYIQQNSNGSLQVLAATSGGELFRTSSDDVTTTLNPIVYMASPVPVTGDDSIDFRYMRGCETTSNNCDQGVAMTVAESVTYSGDAVIDTNVGRFNTLRLDFSGSITANFDNLLFDFRGACTTRGASYEGQAFVFPEVGIVFYDYLCTSADASGISHNFRVRLSQTNVPIPEP